MAQYSSDDADRSRSPFNLVQELWDRFHQSGEQEYLDESIACTRTALDLRPEGHPERSISLSNLANCLYTRFKQSGRTEDLEKSIALNQSALALRPEGHPERSISLSNLASYLYTRFIQSGWTEDLGESIRLFECSAFHPFSSLLTRLEAVLLWATLSRRQNHLVTHRAYTIALSLLEHMLTLRPTLRMQHELLIGKNNYLTIALEAASYAIEKGMFSQAVEFLEQGRALLWSQMRGFRTALDRLAEANKTLADRFRDTSRQLEDLATSSETGLTGSSRIGAPADTGRNRHLLSDEMLALRRRLSDTQEKTIAEIREIPGFKDFLKATPFEILQDAAKEGPVIMINHCKYRCDALIVLSNKDVLIVCVPLDDKFFVDASNLCNELLETRRKFKPESSQYDEKLRQVMKMIWDRVVCRVVQKLKEFGTADGARILWCPTSVLSAFPFHAAGPFKGADGSTRYLLDDYISSYTPTLKSLIIARSGDFKEQFRLLVVGDSSLPSAKREIVAIRKFGMHPEILIDGDASREAVIEKLKEIRWVHFTCHGLLDSKPFEYSFKLFDAGLTLLDIVRADLPNAELAFLSACHTAEQSPNSAQNEVLHLAAAMHFSGFRSVIGTMWEFAVEMDQPSLNRFIHS